MTVTDSAGYYTSASLPIGHIGSQSIMPDLSKLLSKYKSIRPKKPGSMCVWCWDDHH